MNQLVNVCMMKSKRIYAQIYGEELTSLFYIMFNESFFDGDGCELGRDISARFQFSCEFSNEIFKWWRRTHSHSLGNVKCLVV